MEEGKAAKDGGTLYTFRAADASGCVILTLWNEVGRCVKEFDILLVAGG